METKRRIISLRMKSEAHLYRTALYCGWSCIMSKLTWGTQTDSCCNSTLNKSKGVGGGRWGLGWRHMLWIREEGKYGDFGMFSTSSCFPCGGTRGKRRSQVQRVRVELRKWRVPKSGEEKKERKDNKWSAAPVSSPQPSPSLPPPPLISLLVFILFWALRSRPACVSLSLASRHPQAAVFTVLFFYAQSNHLVKILIGPQLWCLSISPESWADLCLCLACRSSDHRPDDAGGRRHERGADADGRVPADRRAYLPSHGGGLEQNRSAAGRQETSCHWENDQETPQNPGEHQVASRQSQAESGDCHSSCPLWLLSSSPDIAQLLISDTNINLN